MKRARRARAACGDRLLLSPADEARVEALTVAMALAPGVYARNRMFELFANVGVQRAKSRAATLRGIVKQLGRASALTLEREGPGGSGERGFVLRYEIPAMSLSRVAELTRIEVATLRVLASRAGAPCMGAEDEDRVIVDTALARLLDAGGDTGNLARAARDSSAPPP